MLQSMEGDRVERVEIGPAVGWYLKGYQDRNLEQIFSQRSIASRGTPHCGICNEFTEDGDRVAVLFERHKNFSEWESLDVVHSEHVVDEVEAVDSFPHVGHVAEEQTLDYGMSHAVVHGDVKKVDVPQDNGRTIEQSIIENVRLRELVRPEDGLF